MRKVKNEERRVKNCHYHSIPPQQDSHHNKIFTPTRSSPQKDPHHNKVLTPTSQTINNNNKQ